MLTTAADRRKLLILDFDGTVCLGDEPATFYARRADALVAESGLPGLGRSISRIVAQALSADSLDIPEIELDAAGEPKVLAEEAEAEGAHPLAWPLQDGYQLVQMLGRQAGLSSPELGTAFMAAREDITREGLEQTDVHAPEGAPELIAELQAAGVRIALITNSPAAGFEQWLSALGLDGAFDVVVNSARKPFGMQDAMQEAAGEAQLAECRILSVGDIWKNDLAPAAELGGRTILLDRFGTGLGRPHERLASFEEAVPHIRTWAEDSAAS
ncbi:HAD family hydrolase [Nesterenkonia populi]|uniref:HAD family hydrolase n=1 Tax=Nesterenkonia populi TaxID=1591087 RepID=UPI001478FCB9|nr:HAD family hydrolase [Nesterenkonia populi]